ncbi:MAG: SDR family NAD(P)-dependent oxidoreductase [Armatimonadota bacterium]|jgi:3-oxoacyl-[acyl-carrier protein] reductase
MSLKSKVAIVTGGAGYIGSTTARRLASEGATVVVSDVNRELAAEVADAIVAEGGSATAIETDVTSTRSIEAMVAQTIEQHGRIDVLVNVAGGSARKQASTVHGSSEEVIRQVIEVNLLGAIFCARAVLGPMIEQGGGKIVNVASIVALQGSAGHADYAAAKAGVIAFSKTLAMEVASDNINVNCVSPGLVPRPGTSVEHIPRTNYLGKIATAETVSNVIAFLVSDEADFVVGQNYVVDGGRSLGLKGSR